MSASLGLALNHELGKKRKERLKFRRSGGLIAYGDPNATRVCEAMTLIEHEWNVTANKKGRRIFVEISDKVIRSFR